MPTEVRGQLAVYTHQTRAWKRWVDSTLRVTPNTPSPDTTTTSATASWSYYLSLDHRAVAEGEVTGLLAVKVPAPNDFALLFTLALPHAPHTSYALLCSAADVMRLLDHEPGLVEVHAPHIAGLLADPPHRVSTPLDTTHAHAQSRAKRYEQGEILGDQPKMSRAEDPWTRSPLSPDPVLSPLALDTLRGYLQDPAFRSLVDTLTSEWRLAILTALEEREEHN